MSKSQVLRPLRLLFSRNQCFFLTLNSKLLTARCMVDTLTLTTVLSARSHNSTLLGIRLSLERPLAQSIGNCALPNERNRATAMWFWRNCTCLAVATGQISYKRAPHLKELCQLPLRSFFGLISSNHPGRVNQSRVGLASVSISYYAKCFLG